MVGLEGNESPVFVSISGCVVAAVAHRNFYCEAGSPTFSLIFLNPKPLRRRVTLLKIRNECGNGNGLKLKNM